MNPHQNPSQDNAPFSENQIEALERIATENHTTPACLITLAIEAMIAEAARNEGKLPLPKSPDAVKETSD